MIKTYSLKHGINVGKFLYAYLDIIIGDIWSTVTSRVENR